MPNKMTETLIEFKMKTENSKIKTICIYIYK